MRIHSRSCRRQAILFGVAVATISLLSQAAARSVAAVRIEAAGGTFPRKASPRPLPKTFDRIPNSIVYLFTAPYETMVFSA